jgi:hypothetical protein
VRDQDRMGLAKGAEMHAEAQPRLGKELERGDESRYRDRGLEMGDKAQSTATDEHRMDRDRRPW